MIPVTVYRSLQTEGSYTTSAVKQSLDDHHHHQYHKEQKEDSQLQHMQLELDSGDKDVHVQREYTIKDLFKTKHIRTVSICMIFVW